MALSAKKAIVLNALEATAGVKETLVAGDGGLAITEITYGNWDVDLMIRNLSKVT